MSSSVVASLQAARRFSGLLAYGAAIAIAVLLRTIFTAPIETGGDAAKKWQMVQALADGARAGDLLINHHTARWGINLPATLLVELFGSPFWIYYAIPILFFAAFLVCAAYFVQHTARRPLFVFLVFLFVLYGEPIYFRSTSQLQPFVFTAAYMMLHVIFVMRTVSKPTHLNYFLAALFIFLAYGAKETAVFYVPATIVFVLAALGWRQGATALAAIAGYGVVLVVAETALFSASLGRFATRLDFAGVHFSHLDDKIAEEFGRISLGGLLDRWTVLPAYTTILFLAATAATVGLLIRSWRSGRYGVAVLPGLLFLSFGFFDTFMLKSIDPIVPLEPPKPKYLADLVPWAALVVALAAGQVIGAIRAVRVRRAAFAATSTLAGLACIVSLASPGQWERTYPTAGAWLWHADASYDFLKRSLAAGIPLRIARSATMGRILSMRLTTISPDGRSRLTVARAFRNDFDNITSPVRCITLERSIGYETCLRPVIDRKDRAGSRPAPGLRRAGRADPLRRQRYGRPQSP